MMRPPSGLQGPGTGPSPGYPAGIRVGFVFRDICADSVVSARQDRSISRASILSWMSAVSRCRASCRSLGQRQAGAATRSARRGQVQAGVLLTTSAQSCCRRAAAGRPELSRSAPPPSSAPRPPGPSPAPPGAARPSASGTLC